LPFKCNLQRYKPVATAAMMPPASPAAMLAHHPVHGDIPVALLWWGLYKPNSAYTHSLKAPGFNTV
jgi:hypothetical protein